jgi:tetratricopeptide (TPR) repeat protein
MYEWSRRADFISLSCTKIHMQDYDINDDSDELTAVGAVARTAQPPPPPLVEVVVEEPVKRCCICGLDVSHQQRSRDRFGQYWCLHCHEFNSKPDKTPGCKPCPDCGRETRHSMMVEQLGKRICKSCSLNYLAELDHGRAHKLMVTAHPELEIRRLIRKFLIWLAGLAAASVVVTLYHFRLLYVHPKNWVPFESALWIFAAAAVGFGIAIQVQFIRMGIRKRIRLANYDEMIRSAANHVLALEEDSHAIGISEPPAPLRKRVERAVTRVRAFAGQGIIGAGEVLESLSKKSDVTAMIKLLCSQRPNTTDTVARNREIGTISYLQSDLPTATLAINAILQRLPHDQDAMTRQALICFRNGELELSKKIFKRVIHIAREKNSDIDLAAAYCNLGMLHVMLSEFDDAAIRYNQAMTIYKRLSLEEGQAECLVNLCLIAYRQKKGAEVEDQFRKAMTMNKKCNRLEGIAVCSSMLGVILLEKEVPELKESETLLNQAVKLNLELGRPGGVATAYGNLGLIRVKRQDFNGARELFLKAQAIYQRINRPKMTAKIQGMLKTVGTLSAAHAGRK